MKRKLFYWKLKDREIRLGDRTLILGVLNVTPDSFSDGGKYLEPDRAFAKALELEEAGADILDIGAESTRPGSSRISASDELQRLGPVLTRLRGKFRIPSSGSTYHPQLPHPTSSLGGAAGSASLPQPYETPTRVAAAAAGTAAVLGGAHIVRGQDVAEMRAAIHVADGILKGAATE